MKNRIKSPVVWLAVLAQVGIITALFVPEMENTVKVVGACVIEILTLFGILNNPADSENF
ncbi:MAG: hypothetical protein J1E05_07090 [Eubacterium sp.]|nr:hypothetical protein [Eubacterium sp.]